MTAAIQHTRPNGARRATAFALAAAALVLAGPALAQGTAGGVTYDPNALANNFLTWLQPLLTVVAIAITAAASAGSANNPRQIGPIVGAGVFAIGCIWGFPYIPTAIGVATNALTRA